MSPIIMEQTQERQMPTMARLASSKTAMRARRRSLYSIAKPVLAAKGLASRRPLRSRSACYVCFGGIKPHRTCGLLLLLTKVSTCFVYHSSSLLLSSHVLIRRGTGLKQQGPWRLTGSLFPQGSQIYYQPWPPPTLLLLTSSSPAYKAGDCNQEDRRSRRIEESTLFRNGTRR